MTVSTWSYMLSISHPFYVMNRYGKRLILGLIQRLKKDKKLELQCLLPHHVNHHGVHLNSDSPPLQMARMFELYQAFHARSLSRPSSAPACSNRIIEHRHQLLSPKTSMQFYGAKKRRENKGALTTFFKSLTRRPNLQSCSLFKVAT